MRTLPLAPKVKKLTVMMSAAEYRGLQKFADKAGETMSRIIREFIRKCMGFP